MQRTRLEPGRRGPSRSLRAGLAGLVAAAALLAPAGAGQGDSGENRTEYRVNLLGLPVAHMSFVTELDGRSYTISGRLRTAGLVDVIESTRGRTAVSGTLMEDRLQASSYMVAYTSGDEARRYDVEFRRGNVTAARRTPPKPRTGDWVPVPSSDLRAVLDPISGLVFPAGSPACPRTVPIFDGETRVDLRLEPKGWRRFRTKGFNGDALACTVRFLPRSGYRAGNDSIEFLREVRGMEVWFARNPRAALSAPVYAKVPTKIGPVTVWATRFGG